MSGDPSERLLIRQGRLAQTERADPAGSLDAREPEELFEFDAGADSAEPHEQPKENEPPMNADKRG